VDGVGKGSAGGREACNLLSAVPGTSGLLDLSPKTIQKHVDNLWVLGGVIIRDLNQTPSLRKLPVERLLSDLIEDGGPLLYHGDSEEQQSSFESTCKKFRRFLTQPAR